METQKQEQTVGEKLRAKYGVRNSSELAWKIAKKYYHTQKRTHKFGPELESEVIISQSSDNGLTSPYDLKGCTTNYQTMKAIANRVLWSRGFTFGREGEKEVSDLENRMRILDGLHWAREGWLSGYTTDPDAHLKNLSDKRYWDGETTWRNSYACWLLYRAYGFGQGFRNGFDLNHDHQKRLIEYSKKNPGCWQEDFDKKMTYAMANRFHEASEGSLGRVKSWEKDAMAEIFEEIKHRIVLRIKKPYESRNLSESQWEDYKRAKLNPNPSMFDRVYYYVYTFIGGRK